MLPALHAGFVDTIREAVASDPRLDALLAAGSYIHGGFDQHSDLDFVIVCNDADYADVMASRQRSKQPCAGVSSSPYSLGWTFGRPPVSKKPSQVSSNSATETKRGSAGMIKGMAPATSATAWEFMVPAEWVG